RCIKSGETRIGLERVVAKLKKKCGCISFIFCTDAYLHKLNEQYLSHDTYTDVITFDYTEKNVFDEPSAEEERSSQYGEAKKHRMKPNVLSGDIFISIDRIRENAKIFNVKQADELIRVMVHGILHLAGYGDKTPAESKKMREMEDLMMAHGFPNL
ncbi:MAG: rRNA maturation RNase YbeY, partial [Bacteroidales bacterium]|nr:rRNA maturation RNase YbeY [Bacteroidales bacterium]